MQRHYAPLALFIFLLLSPLMLVVLPAAEWFPVAVYFVVLALGGVALYQRGIKPVDPTFPAALFVLAVLAKLLGSLVRYWTVVDLYDGASDAPLYHHEGQFVAGFFKLLDFSIMNTHKVRGEGTTQFAFLTGFLYTVMPASMPGAFFFFAGLAFAGSVFFYRAARIAWPDADTGIYRVLIFFAPSILFWPSSLGKDAWILFCSGLVMLGWSVFIRRVQLRGLLLAAAGLFLVAYIRPHIAAMLALGMGGAYLLYGTRGRHSALAWLAGAVAVTALAVFLFRTGFDFLGIDDLSVEAVRDFYDTQQRLTAAGGSRYAAASVFTPTGAVLGLITAVARPFPWEARNPQVLLASLETVVWLILCWTRRKVFWQKITHLRSDPVMGFAALYTLAMLMALTAISNFGILTRQRMMVLPYLWLLFV